MTPPSSLSMTAPKLLSTPPDVCLRSSLPAFSSVILAASACTSPTLIGFVVELRLHFLCPYSMIDSEEDVKSAFLPSVKYTLPSQNLSPSLTSVFTTLLLEPLICTHLHSIVLLLPCVPSTRPLGLIKMRRNHLSNLPNSILFSFSPFPPSFPLPFLLLSFDELFGECFTPLPPLALLVSSFLSAPLTMFFPSLICLFLVLASPPLFSLPWAFVTPSFPLAIFSTTFFSSLVSDPPARNTLPASCHLDPQATRCSGPLPGCVLLRFSGPFPGCSFSLVFSFHPVSSSRQPISLRLLLLLLPVNGIFPAHHCIRPRSFPCGPVCLFLHLLLWVT